MIEANAATDSRPETLVRWIAGLACLSIDVETNPVDGNRIFRIGAVRSDTEATVDVDIGRVGAAESCRRIDAVSVGADVLVGHNIRRHDWPALSAQYPSLSCLRLPLLDTLELSPLAFPANPYHRLVKGYKLVSDARNDPVRDSRVALQLLQDEVEAFDRMHLHSPEWVGLLHFLVERDVVLDRLLKSIRGRSAPGLAEAENVVVAEFEQLCCQTRLTRLARDELRRADESWSIAYALSWLRVSGGNSVLPPWVYGVFPMVRRLLHELREVDCGNASCRYCSQQHNPESLLLQHFQKPAFRPRPTAPGGGSLQREIVVAGLNRKSLLAVLPTGGGKSICYQLPAVAHFWRTGKLTVIVSPLQSLMKDQVDNLVAAGIQCAVTINGLLTPPERRAALDKIRLGDAGIVLVSPEQFRNRGFAEAIRFRQIATWVFDEAHCLSKWGHDFRTDYLYVARFIREHFGDQLAPVACFTATAKLDVIDDLLDHFGSALGIELQKFLGGHERDNLEYTVVPVTKAEKAQRIVEILGSELRHGGAGVVFCSTQRATQDYAELMTKAGLRCAFFHGGLPPGDKKAIQQAFIQGEVDVIAATNAFGMGVDKADVRVVVHAQIPGSLENYLQEAGRAGRDGAPAKCVLLFDEEDVEAQFRLAARSQLTQRDFAALLKGIRRRADRFRSAEIVVSAKELLAESDGADIGLDAPDATTKVTTTVAWLERSGFLRRNENRSRVFPTSLRVPTLEAAVARIRAAELPEKVRRKYETVAACLFRDLDPEGVSTDELMLGAGIDPDDCFRILHGLEQLGILTNDLGLTAAVSKGVTGASDLAFERLDRVERELLNLMAEQAPDADQDGTPQLLSIRPICSELRRRLGLPEGDATVNPEALRLCLRSLAENFGSSAEKRVMLQVRGVGTESLRVALHRPWSRIQEICRHRRAVAQVVLAALLAKLPPGTKQAGYVVECKAKELLAAIQSDLEIRGWLKDPALALEHALLYLHENGVLQLDKGRAVFRAAMTIELNQDALKRRFLKEDFTPLQEHYRERTLQTHVMHEFAKLGSQKMARALALVAAYFSWPRRRFLKEYFKGRTDLLELATTDDSYRRIVDALQHPVQQELVRKPDRGNHLVLAGPGSGKTRVIVHRIAYLLRVRRVAPERIIALAFNRSAAMELRRRLHALVGDDARGVTVMTYHAMALRLTGTSLAGMAGTGQSVDFDKLLQDAIDLLEGRSEAFSDADEARDRLLRGYEYIFVDEYQDIDAQQYALVSALAGRRIPDSDGRLSIMAVGDDDQNIYSFKGANVEFIRRFQSDYDCEISYLVENFRSTQHIITASNHLIQRAAQRMKLDHPIRIDARRVNHRPGGRWTSLDLETQGRVRLVAAPADPNLQAQLVFDEISRIRRSDPDTGLGDIAVLARTHRSLEPLRALCEVESMRFAVLGRDESRGALSLMRSREGWRVARTIRRHGRPLLSTAALARWVARQGRFEPENPFWMDLRSATQELALASPGLRMPNQEALEWLFEYADEARREGSSDALRLMTAHGAKGLEFPHVIVMDCGDWNGAGDDERRLLYVAMTRARETLTMFRAARGGNPFLQDLEASDGVADVVTRRRPSFRAELQRRYVTLGPRDVDIGYAGRFPASHSIHRLIGKLSVGSDIKVEDRSIKTVDGMTVGKLARSAKTTKGCLRGTVTGIMARTRAQTAAAYADGLQTDDWEVVLVELVDESN